MSRNLGQSSLRRKRRSGDPMPAYDGLPAPAETVVISRRFTLVARIGATLVVQIARQGPDTRRDDCVAERGGGKNTRPRSALDTLRFQSAELIRLREALSDKTSLSRAGRFRSLVEGQNTPHSTT